MNFFEHQRLARRNSKILVFVFILGIALTIIANYSFAVFYLKEKNFWNLELFLKIAPVVALIIFIGSTSQYIRFSGDGRKVAVSLGGRLVPVDTKEPKERQALNIVEEMAIASGMPIPPLYILDHVDSINAFASGTRINKSVVAISKGCLNKLTRSELQGVIAHEFSHILNGDMRLNIKLLACVAGLTLLSEIGLMLARLDSSDNNDRKNRGNVLGLIGIGIYLTGIIGTCFGTLIQLALSRQKEFLADSSAVQFTRQTDGLASALKKISAIGSKIDHSETSKFAHVFFADGVKRWFGNIFSTHPNINSRIKRLDPNYIQNNNQVTVQEFSKHIGSPISMFDNQVISKIENSFNINDINSEQAKELVYLILAKNNSVDINNIKISNELVSTLEQHETLTLLELAITRLRNLSPEEKITFINNCKKISEADRKYDLFEMLLNAMFINRFSSSFIKSNSTAFSKQEAIEALIICFAKKTGNSVNEISNLLNFTLNPNPKTVSTVGELIDIFSELNKMNLNEKELIFNVLIRISAKDNIISHEESMLIRIIGLSLEIPIPIV